MKENKSAVIKRYEKPSQKNNTSAKKLIQTPEKDILQHDHDILQICPG
jgi:hypothetical protein